MQYVEYVVSGCPIMGKIIIRHQLADASNKSKKSKKNKNE